MITDQAESPATSNAHRPRAVAYAIAAAGLAAAFLFLPILLLGFTLQVIASVAAGEIIAWPSSVGLTYAILGPAALLSSLLLLIPFLVWHAAARLIGRSRATLWVGGLLAAALAGVAFIWFFQALLRSSQPSQPEHWYALAFVAAAVVVLLVSVLLARGAAVAAFVVLGAAIAGVLVLVVTLVAVWGSRPRIPADAQTLHVISTPSGIEIQPDSVHAGPIYFFADGPEDTSGHGEVTFVSAGYAPSSDDAPLPLTEEGIRALTQGDSQGTSMESVLPGVSKLTLLEGSYAFVVYGAEGEQPGVAPTAIAVLEIRP